MLRILSFEKPRILSFEKPHRSQMKNFSFQDCTMEKDIRENRCDTSEYHRYLWISVRYPWVFLPWHYPRLLGIMNVPKPISIEKILRGNVDNQQLVSKRYQRKCVARKNLFYHCIALQKSKMKSNICRVIFKF